MKIVLNEEREYIELYLTNKNNRNTTSYECKVGTKSVRPLFNFPRINGHTFFKLLYGELEKVPTDIPLFIELMTYRNVLNGSSEVVNQEEYEKFENGAPLKIPVKTIDGKLLLKIRDEYFSLEDFQTIDETRYGGQYYSFESVRRQENKGV